MIMHSRGNIRDVLLNLWFNVGFKDAQQTDLHFDRTPTDAYFSLVYGFTFFLYTGCAQATCMGCASKVQHPMFEELGSTYDEAPAIGNHVLAIFCLMHVFAYIAGREYQAPLLRTR